MTFARVRGPLWFHLGAMRWSAPLQLAQERFAHAATLLADGRVLLTGGARAWVEDVEVREALYQESLTSAEVMDPATGIGIGRRPQLPRCSASGWAIACRLSADLLAQIDPEMECNVGPRGDYLEGRRGCRKLAPEPPVAFGELNLT